ncbi:MAG: DUF1365 family protein [Alphaproteobacteria bacterium]|nr:DUF1365 family protein [Alphaproteobacteria bacterium]
MEPHEGIYAGSVMHRRFRPKMHHFKYSVFAVLADVDALSKLGGRLWLFSHNRFNLFSMHDKDFGKGDNLRLHLDGMAETAVGAGTVKRFIMLCYPRVLGYVFNPLTVYYGLDAEDEVAVTIYEVSNTFGERHSYVMATSAESGGVIRHNCEKVFHVSPFNRVSGRYMFRTALPGDTAAIGIRLDDDDGPLLAAHFAGSRRPITDRQLLKQFTVNTLLTQKVWLTIRWEALRLWMRALPIYKKPSPPQEPMSVHKLAEKRFPDDIAA